MTNEIIQRMTRKQAEELDAIARNSEARKRLAVYLLHRSEGFRALGYNEFKDYVEERLDVTFVAAYEWVNQVQATCDAQGFSSDELLTMLNTEKVSLLPQTVTRELRKLPSVDRREVWLTYETLSDVNGVAHHASSRDLARTLKNLVTQRLALTAPVVTPSLPEAPTTNTPPAPSQEPTTNAPQQAQERAKRTVTTSAPPAEIFPDTDDAADFDPEEEPEPILHRATARTVQRDDGLKCLIIEACLPNGDEVMLRLPFAMLPRDMQP